MKAINFFKALGKAISTTRDSVGSSTDFIDEILEKEYLVNGVESIKEATGKVIEVSGSTYQKSKDVLDKVADKLENVRGTVEKSTIRKNSGKRMLKAPEHIEDIEPKSNKPVGEIIEISKKVKKETESLLDEIKKNLDKK